MSKPSKRHPQAGDTRSPTFKMRPIAVACSGLMFIAGAAYAAEPVAADDAVMETVVVTGMRHSIETSIAAKKNSDSIVEVVSAEDIGKLPDISIAESLARLPGLTAQRVDGRAQSISIRGMGPKYGVTLLNGREIVSTGDGRTVEYDQFPSELLNSATVYKTPDAALSAMGLSGTVNLKSVRPLDYKERKISFNIRGEYNGNDSGSLSAADNDIGGRISASYINQFADNTVGIALGYAHLDNPGQEKYYKSYGWADLAKYPNQSWCSGGSCVRPGTVAGQQVLLGFEAGTTSTERKRDGFMAELEYKPNDKFHSMVDLYYSKFDQTSIQREFQSGLDQWGGVGNSGATYVNPVISQVNGFNVVTGGTIGNVQPIILNRYNTRKDKTIAIGWNTEYKLDQWKFGADLSYSRARRNEYNGELSARAMTGAALTTVSLQAALDATGSRASTFIPSIDYSNPALVKLADAYGRGGRATLPLVDDQMKALRFDVERIFDNSPVTSVQGGVIYSDRTKDMKRDEVFYRRTGAPQIVAPNLLNAPAAISQSSIPGILSWDYLGSLNAYYTPYDPNQPWSAATRKWNVEEKVTTGFAKANFDVDWTVPVRGNVGVQLVHTNMTSIGNFWNNKATPNRLEPLKFTNSYTDVLPSLNMTFDLGKVATKDLYLRFGAAKEMARPPMDSMRASLDGGLSPTTFLWSGSGGNPQLKPWKADAYDLSLEKYFGKRSYIAAAYFHKSIESSIYNQTVRYDFSGFPITILDPLGNPIVPLSNIGNMTTQANGEAGYVRGKEISFSLDGSLLNSSLDGIGFIASLGSTESSIKEKGENLGTGAQPATGLEGLSGITRNLTAYYERNGFNARISQRYRSAFAAQTRNQFGDLATSTIESEKLVDLQVGYAIENGQYKGLSVLFQINNLTDEPYRTSKSSDYDPTLSLPERYNTHGRQFLLGLTYKM